MTGHRGVETTGNTIEEGSATIINVMGTLSSTDRLIIISYGVNLGISALGILYLIIFVKGVLYPSKMGKRLWAFRYKNPL